MMEENRIPLRVTFNSAEETARQVLEKLISANFKTVFVGAVYKIEQEFGYLWGESEDFDEKNLSDEQKFYYEKFLKLREETFDQGNRERKRALATIKSFDVRLGN